MIRLFKSFVRLILFVLFIVLIFNASGYAVSTDGVLPNQIRKAKKTKTTPNKKMNEALTGEWSGEHITINFTEQGARVEYDCASGAIDRKIILDKKNRFTVTGIYTEEYGGPVRLDDKTGSVAVKYIGQVNGKKMTLSVRRADDGAVVGNFTLHRGQESLLVKCR